MLFRETQEEMKKLTNQRLIKIFEFLLAHTADEQLMIWSDEQSRLWNEIKNRLTQKDTIPVEWIKNYARKICADDAGRYNSKAYGIDRMIYDWEKENETN